MAAARFIPWDTLLSEPELHTLHPGPWTLHPAPQAHSHTQEGRMRGGGYPSGAALVGRTIRLLCASSLGTGSSPLPTPEALHLIQKSKLHTHARGGRAGRGAGGGSHPILRSAGRADDLAPVRLVARDRLLGTHVHASAREEFPREIVAPKLGFRVQRF